LQGPSVESERIRAKSAEPGPRARVHTSTSANSPTHVKVFNVNGRGRRTHGHRRSQSHNSSHVLARSESRGNPQGLRLDIVGVGQFQRLTKGSSVQRRSSRRSCSVPNSFGDELETGRNVSGFGFGFGFGAKRRPESRTKTRTLSASLSRSVSALGAGSSALSRRLSVPVSVHEGKIRTTGRGRGRSLSRPKKTKSNEKLKKNELQGSRSPLRRPRSASVSGIRAPVRSSRASVRSSYPMHRRHRSSSSFLRIVRPIDLSLNLEDAMVNMRLSSKGLKATENGYTLTSRGEG